MTIVEYHKDKEKLLSQRLVQYDEEGNVEISGFPPKDWDELTNEQQFLEVYKITGIYFPIKSIKFDH